MSELICPMSNEPCENRVLCDVVNEPLDGCVTDVMRSVEGGVRPGIARAALRRELTSQGTMLATDLHISDAPEGSMAACPENVIMRLGHLQGPHRTAIGVATLLRQGVENVVEDLQSEHQRRTRP